MPVPFYLLETTRVNGIMQALQDVRLLPQALKFVARTPDTLATDGEVMARFTGYVTVADLVPDDQSATVYNNGKLTFESYAIPNLKHGSVITQEMLNMLRSINSNGGITNDQVGFFRNYEQNTINGLRLGIEQRKEAMIVAMQLDSLNYSRLGLNITNATWGMPADLKVTTAVTWDTSATADGITDIMTLQTYASVRYGETYNRATMSTTAFRYLINQVATQGKLRFVLPSGTAANIIPINNLLYMRSLIEAYLGMQIELYDARYWQMDGAGALTQAPYLPITKVILSDMADDNDPNVMDFANAVTTESIVADLGGSAFGGFGGPQPGPISYVTGNSDMNPPNLTYWGVARGFPRKKRLQATAVLTVGSFTDSIPVGPPY